MSSIVITWDGRWTDADDRSACDWHLLSFARWYPEKIAVKRWDQTLDGITVISPDLVGDLAGSDLAMFAIENDLELVTDGPRSFFLCREVHVIGSEIQVVDQFTATQRFSFVAIEKPAALRGFLVEPDRADRYAYLRSGTVDRADWMLDSPGAHLRYLLESPLVQLLIYVRYFFLSGLNFSRGRGGNDIDEFVDRIRAAETQWQERDEDGSGEPWSSEVLRERFGREVAAALAREGAALEDVTTLAAKRTALHERAESAGCELAVHQFIDRLSADLVDEFIDKSASELEDMVAEDAARRPAMNAAMVELQSIMNGTYVPPAGVPEDRLDEEPEEWEEH